MSRPLKRLNPTPSKRLPTGDPDDAELALGRSPFVGLVCDPDGIGVPRIQTLDAIDGPESGAGSQRLSRETLPLLRSNEQTRLKMLWYYTRGLRDDQDSIPKITQLIDLARLSIGWEGASAGFLEAGSLRQLASVSSNELDMAWDESVCSHILNHDPGTLLTVQDRVSPSVSENVSSHPQREIRSYAGAQIRLSLHDGTHLILGCLCIFSQSSQVALTDSQKSILVHSADMITSEFVTRTRINRLRERQIMTDALVPLRSIKDDPAIKSKVVSTIRPRYPEAEIVFAQLSNNMIIIPGFQAIDFAEVEAGLWENRDIADSDSENELKVQPEIKTPTRAIVGRVTPQDQLLVVVSTERNLVFDDLDAWFVDQCAQIIHVVSQAHVLKEALVAKDRFLRSVTHELRTPIHGVLSAADLLSDELTTHKTLVSSSQTNLDKSQVLLETFLQTIRRSGSELMRTVNDILRFNTFASSDMTPKPTHYDLQNLERDVTDEIMANFIEDELQLLSIRFENHFPNHSSVVTIDADLLKEVLKYLLFNALTAVTQGTITVTTRILIEEGALEIDVADTGMGINQKDRERIFLAFEKADTHSSGVGLGLSLASKVISTLGGRLSLASSELGTGSRFNIKIPGVKVATHRSPLSRRWSIRMRHLPGQFTVRAKSDRNPHLVSHLEEYLLDQGLTKSDTAQGSLIIINQSTLSELNNDSEICALDGSHMMMIVHDTLQQPVLEGIQPGPSPHLTWPITGPFFRPRLDGIFIEADRAFGIHKKSYHSRPASADTQPTKFLKRSSPSNEPDTPPIPRRPNTIRPNLVSTLSDRPMVKALLVDDNDVNLSVLQFFCKKRKIKFGSATDGSQAFDLFSNSRLEQLFNLVLMDLQMPVCDGLESCRMIRQFEAKHHLPRSIIYIVTGQDSIADRNNSFEAGADDYFVKPVSMKKLEQAIIQAFPESPS